MSKNNELQRQVFEKRLQNNTEVIRALQATITRQKEEIDTLSGTLTNNEVFRQRMVNSKLIEEIGELKKYINDLEEMNKAE